MALVRHLCLSLSYIHTWKELLIAHPGNTIQETSASPENLCVSHDVSMSRIQRDIHGALYTRVTVSIEPDGLTSFKDQGHLFLPHILPYFLYFLMPSCIKCVVH